MATQVFWDANFKVKALEPVFVDKGGLTSPINFPSATPVNIELPDGTKSVLIKTDTTTAVNKITVQVSKTPNPGPPVAELGDITVELDNGDLSISTENITYLIITKLGAGARDIPLTYFIA